MTAKLKPLPLPPDSRDPRERKDGKCVVCQGERPEMAVKSFDPFCKTECCKRWYGITFAS